MSHKQLSQYELFFELSPDALIICGFNGSIKRRNKILERILGYDPFKLNGCFNLEFLNQFVHSDDHQRTREEFVKLKMGLELKQLENRCKTKNGTYKWFSWSAIPVVERQEIYIVGRDINDQKNAELALEHSKEFFRNALENMLDSFVICSAVRNESGVIVDFICEYVNEATCVNVKMSREEQIGRRMSELFPGNWESGIFEYYSQVVNTGQPLMMDSVPYKPEKIDQRMQGAYDFKAFKLGDGFAVTWRNISEKHQMQEALRQSEKRFEKVFHLSPYMLSIIRLSDQRYIDVNRRFLSVRNFKREEVIGKTPIDLGVSKEHLMAVLALNSVDNYETTLVKKNKENGTVLVSVEHIELDGEECVLLAYNDITEFKKIQKEVTHLESLRLVGQMAAGIAHEVRNPITIVRGYLQLFQEKREFSGHTEAINLMLSEMDRANHIITEFLSLTRDKNSEFSRGNLNSLISDLLPLLQTNAISYDKIINAELEDIPDLYLDAMEIRQLLINLCKNGLEAMEKDGCLTIRTYVEEGLVVLNITDQGPGIDPNEISKLGTPFFTTKENGTGLGLAICHSIAARHNATIDVETGSNGTSFYIRFKP